MAVRRERLEELLQALNTQMSSKHKKFGGVKPLLDGHFPPSGVSHWVIICGPVGDGYQAPEVLKMLRSQKQQERLGKILHQHNIFCSEIIKGLVDDGVWTDVEGRKFAESNYAIDGVSVYRPLLDFMKEL